MSAASLILPGLEEAFGAAIAAARRLKSQGASGGQYARQLIPLLRDAGLTADEAEHYSFRIMTAVVQENAA